GLAEHLRALLLAASTGRADLIEATDATRARYLDDAQGWAEADLLHLLMIVDEAERHLKASRQPRLTTELALLRMASLAPAADLQRLLDKLERLEKGGVWTADGGRKTGDGGAGTTDHEPRTTD